MSTISKTSTFEVPKFSQIFSPLPFRWVLPAGFGALGPRLPRQNTAACGSPERPRLGRPIARRGQGSGGSAEPQRPWPRDEGFGEENLLEAMGSFREEVDEMLIRFKVLVDLCFHFLWKVSVKTRAPPFCFVLCGHDISRLCPLSTLSCFFFGPALGSDFAPEFGECPPLKCDICLSAGLIT